MNFRFCFPPPSLHLHAAAADAAVGKRRSSKLTGCPYRSVRIWKFVHQQLIDGSGAGLLACLLARGTFLGGESNDLSSLAKPVVDWINLRSGRMLPGYTLKQPADQPPHRFSQDMEIDGEML